LQWGLRDEQAVRLGALKQAADKAREKSAVLIEALHVKLVRGLSINEGGHVMRPPVAMAWLAMEESVGDVPISSSELKVIATVTLIDEIASN